jgi:CheY-like chemotaxis protein/signal transduction histidine kinase
MWWLWFSVIALELGILALDALTPRGINEVTLYLIPVALTVLARSALPAIVAALVATAFTLIGLFISSEGADRWVSELNRGFTIATVWCVALLVRHVIGVRKQAERQGWLVRAQSELAHRLRGDLNLRELGERALELLARYGQAQLGAVYARREQRDELERVAGFAFPAEETGAAKRVRLGDGIIGEAAAHNRFMTISAAPSEHLTLRSGLLATPPRHVMVAPLTAEGRPEGVVELAFTKPPHPQAQALLEACAELIGVAMRAAQHKARLAELLARTQQQAEEMQAQQEELRVLNEELEQQNRAQKEYQSRLENQQAELEQTNQQLEEQAQLLERQKAALVEGQKRLKEKSDDLARASRYKSEFLANMSHELRTPLNSALILSKLLADNKQGNLTPEQVRYAETIYRAGNDLLGLINDVLDLSKVEAGKMEVRREPFALADLLETLEAGFRPVAREKALGFQVVVEEGVPEEVSSDRQRIEQILKNLLSNAFKFTDKGGVTLRVRRQDDGLALSVQDTGAGIPRDQQERVFNAFQQLDGTDSRQHGGTGLGLSIARDMAHLLGGEIELESEEGRGSTFTLRLPLEQPATAAAAPPATPAPQPVAALPPAAPAGTPAPQFSFQDDRERITEGARTMLIVEDDETFARILFDLAHEMDFLALVAPNGTEGLALATRFLPNAIVLDVRLPDLNGLAVLGHLKADPRTRHIPVHMVSGDDFSDTARHLGAAGYLLKPVKRQSIEQAFRELEARMSQKLKRLLVVEDDPTQRESMVELIAGPDVRITAVETAHEALERLSRDTFDCMVMDLNLPDMSGYDLLAELSRDDSTYSYPPVIVYTGRDLSRDEEERLRRYSSSIIVKGARSPERLLSEVTLFLHRVETDLPPERQKMLHDLRAREQVLEGAKILLVDDDVRNVFALTSVLEPQGVSVEIARNGKEALEKLEQAPDVDLVLMDIMMPVMNGLDATRAIREQPRFKKLPIIALTAKAMREDQEKCLEAGANDYLAKPVDVDKLLSLLRVWLTARQGF